MSLLLLALVIYPVLALITSNMLFHLSVPALLLIIYVLPIVINSVIVKFQKEKLKFLTSFVLPTVSIGFYTLFSYLTNLNNTWIEYAISNTVSDESMSLEVATDLLDPSQLLFVVAIYYGVSLAYHFISQKIYNKGVNYA